MMLVLHCAAGLRKPVAEIARAYTAEVGQPVRLNYGPSGGLEVALEVAGGDLYLPADVSYIESTRKKGLTEESIPAAYLFGGIAVAKGNPARIESLSDLAKPGVKVVLANPEAAVGKFTRKVLAAAGLETSIVANVIVTKPTVNEVTEAVELGLADAGIVWDAVAAQYSNVDFVHVPEFDAKRKEASIAVLTSSSNPTAALRFARFLTASDRGLPFFAKHGFKIGAGDKWAPTPRLTFFSGSMLRPAIEKQLAAFQKREGVEVSVIFEGCGTLVSQMKAGAKPDAYFSCDTKFLDMVQDRFAPGTIVTSNQMVFLVPKGNPKQIDDLANLAKRRLKIGIAHPEKSALGDLTIGLLKRLGLHEALEASGNIEIYASKGDDLVNLMQIGALDAAIVYRSNANASPPILENCDIVDIDDPDAFATQPFAISLKSDFPHLSKRLQEALTGNAGKTSFLKYGFSWKMPAGSTAP